MSRRYLVTGGTGYFGSVLVRQLLETGAGVCVLDLNDADDRPPDVELFQGDIRDPALVARACRRVDTVFHNVAQVPLARDNRLFDSVNVGGAQVLADAAAQEGVRRVVVTSSSAVYGVPRANPITPRSAPNPMEPYGRAKLGAERVFLEHPSVEASIIRPRTILGHGRLGVFSVLFDWVSTSDDVYVLGSGDNCYQFVHAEDLGRACLAAATNRTTGTWNVGAAEFSTMRGTLEALIEHAGSRSRVLSLPMAPAVLAMKTGSRLGLLPFGPYHWLMYGRSMWFDIKATQSELGWSPSYTTNAMFAESYDWFLEHQPAESGSHHRTSLRSRGLDLVRQGSRAKRAIWQRSELGRRRP